VQESHHVSLDLLMPEDVVESMAAHNLAYKGDHTNLDIAYCVCKAQVAALKPQAGLPDGGICFKCGGMTIRTGTCTACTSCGESGGCS
jgi:hypothetical protein